MDFDTWNMFWSLSFGLLASFIFTGNLLTIVIFSTRRLRNRSHFLLMSLATADLLVGLLSIPVYITFHVHYTTRFFIVVFDCIDMFSGLASIFTVTLISLERMHAISWPLRHRSLSNRIYVAGIALPWILAAMVTSTRLLLHFSIITRCHFVILIIISLSSPLTITICCYRSIWKNIKSRLPNPHRTGSDEKLIKTLMQLTVCFLVTRLPFEVLVVFLNLCVSCRQLPMVAVYIIKFLHYSNSVVNFIVYPLRINEFKETLVNLFPWKRGEQMSQFSSGITVLSMTTLTGTFHSLSFDPTEETSQL